MPLNATQTRRHFLGSALGALGAVAAGGAAISAATSVVGGSSRLLALDGSISREASAFEPAERMALSDKLTFPVDTNPEYGTLVCLNNFGGRSTANGSCGHAGVDIGNDRVSGRGRPLVACVDGFMEKDEEFSSAGLTRILRDDAGTYYRYHHLDEYESTLAEGDRVSAGQVIGTMGSSGNTNWSHLHFEIWIGSLTPRFATIIDPVPRFVLPVNGVTLNEPTACAD